MAIDDRSGAVSTDTTRALNPDGSLALMPRDLTHELSGELGGLMALLEAVHAVAADDRPDGFHSQETRLRSLLTLAEEKLLASIERMQPYV